MTLSAAKDPGAQQGVEAEHSDVLAKLSRVFELQRNGHLADPYPSAKVREDRIDRMLDMIVTNEKKLLDAVNEDFGRRSAINTRTLDILTLVMGCKHSRKNLRRWMRPEKRRSTFPLGLIGARSSIEFLPLGVVGNISPWNFPVQLSLLPIVDIFAAGNRCMLKPSELTPITSELMADLVSQYYTEDEFSVINGGPDVASVFSGLPFDHLLFTGSTSIAKLVAQSAAPNLVPMTLELGGKNSAIVSPSADLKKAAEKVVWAKSTNGGQVCLCPDIIYVHRSRYETFTQACRKEIETKFPSFAAAEDYINIITQRHADRLQSLMDDAEEKGAELIKFEEAQGQCVPLALVLDPPSEAHLMKEEIFGGLLTLIPYDDYRDVAQRVNAGEKPLALYYFGEDQLEIDFFKRKVMSGGMVINDFFAHCMQEDLPFGGVGASGMGAYHGIDGFKNFSHAKAIFKQSSFDPLSVIRPPIMKNLDRFLNLMIKK